MKRRWKLDFRVTCGCQGSKEDKRKFHAAYSASSVYLGHNTAPHFSADSFLVTNLPDCVAAIFADKQAAVLQLRHAGWPAPDLSFIRAHHPSGDEIFRLPCRFAAFERHKHNRIADALFPVRGSMEGEECASVIL